MLFDEQFAMNLDMIESVLVALAAYFALRAATTWRSDAVGRRKVAFAEEVLVKTYDMKVEIKGYVELLQAMSMWSMYTTNPLESHEMLIGHRSVREYQDKMTEAVSHIMAFESRFVVLFGAENQSVFTELGQAGERFLVRSRMLGAQFNAALIKLKEKVLSEGEVEAVKGSMRALIDHLKNNPTGANEVGSLPTLLSLVERLESRCKAELEGA